MRTAGQVSAEKLRGGFYTPDPLVDACYARIAELAGGGGLRLLEPSAGDGAFLRGLRRSPVRAAVAAVTAIEPLEIEAEKARRALAGGPAGEVLRASAVAWAAATDERFDLAVGNPPFVRYQFVPAADRSAALALGDRLGLRVAGVANLWIPVLLGALSRLRPGGAFAFVVPAECLTGTSAALVRRWLVDRCAALRLDLFAPGSFPEVLQEVAVLSGRRAANARDADARVRIVEDRRAGGEGLDRTHRVTRDGPWTRYLLSPAQVEALETASAAPGVAPLGAVAAFEVSVVTGANDFFTVSDATLERYALAAWARPLLPRIRHAPGLRHTAADHAATGRAGARAWLLDFGPGAPDPTAHAGAAAYLRAGEDRGLPARYKCRIRAPWYRVPGIVRGHLLLSKRSHLHPRVVVNEAGVLTTDTIYRGRMVDAGLPATAIAAGFHSSLTLLGAELEGRSFGGGVLELVPSEVARLPVVAAPPGAGRLERLDALARQSDANALVAATDADLVARGLVAADVMAELAAARRLLLARRLERNRRTAGAEPAVRRAAA
jgi:adenine-specific DNA-methyltransferase